VEIMVAAIVWARLQVARRAVGINVPAWREVVSFARAFVAKEAIKALAVQVLGHYLNHVESASPWSRPNSRFNSTVSAFRFLFHINPPCRALPAS
jgi:hypothetical protein